MGIVGLTQLIESSVPNAVVERELTEYSGHWIAIDASIAIRQFMGYQAQNYLLTNKDGESTAHLGLFYRVCHLLEVGIKPIYVFDGPPPEAKKRSQARRAAARQRDTGVTLVDGVTLNSGNAGAPRRRGMAKALGLIPSTSNATTGSSQSTFYGAKQMEDCKRLLKLMGVPIVESPSEAEAQCAQLVLDGVAHAVATEDMDALAFGADRLIRFGAANNEELNDPSKNRRDIVKEFSLPTTLEGLNISREQFIDLCILMKCDYCEHLPGIGGKRGLELLRKYDSIEGILRNVYEYFPKPDAKEVKETLTLNELDTAFIEDVGEISDSDSDSKSSSGTEKLSSEKDDTDESSGSSICLISSDSSDVSSSSKPKKEQSQPKLVPVKNQPKKKSTTRSVKTKSADSIPDNWYLEMKIARHLFSEPKVVKNYFIKPSSSSASSATSTNGSSSGSGNVVRVLKLGKPDTDGIMEFLCRQNGYSEDRVKKALSRMKAGEDKRSLGRIDSFFKIRTTRPGCPPTSAPEPASVPTGGPTATSTAKDKFNELLFGRGQAKPRSMSRTATAAKSRGRGRK